MMHAQGWLFGGFAMAGGTWLFFHGFQSLRTWRVIRDTPTARVRSMAMGMVELNGSVEPRSDLAAPFTGKPCVYWEVEISTRSGRRQGADSWTVVHSNRSGNPFFLRDETGVAMVYPQGADVKTPFGAEESTLGLGVPDLYMQYMEEQGLGMRRLWAIGAMRFRERVLEQGHRVFVLGRAHPKAMARDVSFDEVELAATGTDGMRASRVRELDSEVRGVIRRGQNGEPFLVSQTSEAGMVLEYGVRAFGGLLGGPPLALFGLWCVLELARTGQLFR
jgi:hypothetical protein